MAIGELQPGLGAACLESFLVLEGSGRSASAFYLRAGCWRRAMTVVAPTGDKEAENEFSEMHVSADYSGGAVGGA